MAKDKKWKKMQLSILSSLRTDEHHTWVNVFYYCMATSAILLVALFNTGDLPKSVIGITISSFGFIVSAVFIRIQDRALNSMKASEDALREAEQELNLVSVTKHLKSAEYLGARTIMTIFTRVQMFAWFGGLIYFICAAFC